MVASHVGHMKGAWTWMADGHTQSPPAVLPSQVQTTSVGLMHFQDACNVHAPEGVDWPTAWVIAHALVPFPTHCSAAHCVPSRHAFPHAPQLAASSGAHLPAQQKCLLVVGQSASTVHSDPHATVAHTVHAATSAPAKSATRFI